MSYAPQNKRSRAHSEPTAVEELQSTVARTEIIAPIPDVAVNASSLMVTPDRDTAQSKVSVVHEESSVASTTSSTMSKVLPIRPNLGVHTVAPTATVTLSPDTRTETDKTVETDTTSISNADFLHAIFGPLPGDVRPLVCNILGDPKTTSGLDWNGQAWIPGTTPTENADYNWYFSLSTFGPDSEGKYRRQKAQFASLAAIMLDDIGTKAAARERLDALPPTWLIETSPGNFQAGYVFDVPVTDEKLATALMKAVIAAGLCDPGSSGPLARYARLPIAVNGKHDPAFPCRLVEWHPERRYSPEEIAVGLALEDPTPPSSTKGVVSSPGRASEDNKPAGNAVYMPRPVENPVVTALKASELYKGGDGAGKHDITCPWVHEHTDAVDSGTAYFEPEEPYPLGGFKCLHGHCAKRHIGTLLDHLGITHGEAQHRAIIRAVPGQLKRVVEAAERELAATGDYFQRSGMIARVVSDPTTGQSLVKEVNIPSLTIGMSSLVHWERFDKREKQYVPIDPPALYINALSQRGAYRHLPPLHGLARQPYLRPDGSLMSAAGYDAATGMYGIFDPAVFHVPDEPTREEALTALDQLSKLLSEFPFAGDVDRSAALAGMLTAAIRPSLPMAPMFHVRAPQISSGKSYLTTLMALFVGPNPPPATSFPSNEEECQKLLLSTFLEGPTVLCFDNLTTDLLPHKTLCSALTDERITGRVLGVSKMATASTRLLVVSSGNNVGPIRDMTRRCVTVLLDPACETPAAREFRNNPVGDVEQNRGYYVSLALTIIRAWIVAGRPKTTCKSLASYTNWTDLIRQPLLWLGLSDPAQSVFESMAVDPDTEQLGRFMQAWKNAFGSKPTMVRDLVKYASRLSSEPDKVELHDVISEIADERGEINKKRLGRWIERHAGRLVDGMRFVKAPKTRNVVEWRVVSVSSVSSVPTSPPTESVSRDPAADISID